MVFVWHIVMTCSYINVPQLLIEYKLNSLINSARLEHNEFTPLFRGPTFYAILLQCCCYALHLHSPLSLLPSIYFNIKS